MSQDRSLHSREQHVGHVGRWTLGEVLNSSGARCVSGVLSRRVLGFSTDTRHILPDELFIALKGDRYDGHQYVRRAFEKGAAGCLVEKGYLDVEDLEKQIGKTDAIFEVSDTLQALWKLARAQRDRLQIPLIAVTGSCGKTSTKELIAAGLGNSEEVYASPASYNNHIGVPLSLLGIRTRHRFAVIELGSNNFGEIGKLSRLARPTVAVITHVGSGHLKGLRDRTGVLDEKLSIVSGLEGSETLILDGDDPALVSGARIRGIHPVLCGWNQSCHFRPRKIRRTYSGTRFQVGRHHLHIRLFGEHDVKNTVMAWAVLDAVNQAQPHCLARFKEVQPLTGRFQVYQTANWLILDDTYNANPSSVRSALATLRNWPSTNRRVVVLGDMLELGAQSERWHRRIGEMVALMDPGLLVTCGAHASSIQEGAFDAGFPSLRSVHFKSSESCAAQIRDVVCDQDMILVKGSRNMHMETIVNRLKEMIPTHALSSAYAPH